MVSAFCALFRDISPCCTCKNEFPELSPRGFVVLPFIVRFIIHLEMIFVRHVRSGLQFILFSCGYPIKLAPFIEDGSFPSALQDQFIKNT